MMKLVDAKILEVVAPLVVALVVVPLMDPMNMQLLQNHKVEEMVLITWMVLSIIQLMVRLHIKVLFLLQALVVAVQRCLVGQNSMHHMGLSQ